MRGSRRDGRSTAFLFQTEGKIRDAITKVTKDNAIFVYGISDRKVGGLDVQRPDGNVAPVFPAALEEHVPEPFKSEPTGGGGTRMHHKFVGSCSPSGIPPRAPDRGSLGLATSPTTRSGALPC